MVKEVISASATNCRAERAPTIEFLAGGIGFQPPAETPANASGTSTKVE
jgi:hypothetical protein